MNYRFKPLPELGWAVLIAVATVVLPSLVSLDPDKIADWRVWAVALGVGAIRAAAGAALDYIRRSVTSEPEPTLADQIMALAPEERAALGEEVALRGSRPSPPPAPAMNWNRDL